MTFVTFAVEKDEDFVDWKSEEAEGFDFSSFFVSGYKLKGEGIRNYQSNWIELWNNTEDSNCEYVFRGMFDFNKNLAIHRVTYPQTITLTQNTEITRKAKRLKVRGRGKALQFRIDSVSGEPFNIEGWSTVDSVNKLP